jgi:nicotinate-nucleotide adenylyltransferase
MNMQIGLYFGSFNPIHIGHLIVAEYMIQQGFFDKIRFVVSPQNPFKEQTDLIPEMLRLNMVQAAIQDNTEFEVSDVEFALPRPSYTIQTLAHFWETESDHDFSIIMGSDNLEKLNTWKDIEKITEKCTIQVYQRHGSEKAVPPIKGNFLLHTAPFVDISATYIRKLIAEKKSLKYLVPNAAIPLLQGS